MYLALAARDTAARTRAVEAADDGLAHALQAEHVDDFVHECAAPRRGPVRRQARVRTVLDDLLHREHAQHHVVLRHEADHVAEGRDGLQEAVHLQHTG